MPVVELLLGSEDLDREHGVSHRDEPVSGRIVICVVNGKFGVVRQGDDAFRRPGKIGPGVCPESDPEPAAALGGRGRLPQVSGPTRNQLAHGSRDGLVEAVELAFPERFS